MDGCVLLCVKQLWEPAIWHREFSSVLCADLKGWDGGWWWEGTPGGRGYMCTNS